VLNLISPDTDRKDEKRFYDTVYNNMENAHTELVSPLQAAKLWHKYDQPELRVTRKAIGNLREKQVLLLGNGASVKELAFLLDDPAYILYSDLSAYGSRAIEAISDLRGFRNRIVFCAVDAQNLFFADSSFDVVYGYAMVHHLPDIPLFLKEVTRVLRPGGKAIFMDDAYSPIWHKSKQTWLRPLMRYSHRTTGISPEDYRFSMAGGFKESVLAEAITTAGAVPWFLRSSLFTYVFFRGTEKLLPRRISDLARQLFGPPLSVLDSVLGKLAFFQRNQIRLIWGLRKPASG